MLFYYLMRYRGKFHAFRHQIKKIKYLALKYGGRVDFASGMQVKQKLFQSPRPTRARATERIWRRRSL